MTALHDLTALEQAAAIRTGEITSVELTEHYLARTEALNETVGAFITVTTPVQAPAQIKTALDAWYRQRAREVFADRLTAIAAPLRWVKQLPPTRLQFMTVQWGSCSPSGRITLNPLLVMILIPFNNLVLYPMLRKLGWEPRTTLEEMVGEMVREDLKAAERDSLCRREGYWTPDHHE